VDQVDADASRQRRPLGNVLVATDFSAGAARAVARAARLPISPGSALTILHVLPAERDAKLKTQLDADARHGLEEAASAAGRAAREAGRRDLDIFTRLVHGRPFVEITKHARQNRAELIVLGRHGRRIFRDLLLGSMAELVIRMGDTSILVVNSAPAGPYRHPLVAVDLSDNSRRAFELALRVVDASVPILEVVHAADVLPLRWTGPTERERRRYRRTVRTGARAAVSTFLATFGEAGRQAKVVVQCGDARNVILAVVRRDNPDLLALSTHGRSGLAHLLLGSVAEAVIREVRCDVLVARPPGIPPKLR
jgi:nucleotide-binding universal stress UspA family protein